MRAADNPFREDRIDQVRYRLRGCAWEELLERLRMLNYRGAIVGSYGSGKTRLLKELAGRLVDQNFRVSTYRVNPQRASVPEGLLKSLLCDRVPGHIVMLDEADRLSVCSSIVLRLLSGKGIGLIVTTHKPGIVPVLAECSSDVELLQEILVDLVGQEERAIRELSRSLFLKHRGNMREVLRSLYDVYAEQELQQVS